VIANSLKEHLQSFELPLSLEHRDITRE